MHTHILSHDTALINQFERALVHKDYGFHLTLVQTCCPYVREVVVHGWQPPDIGRHIKN